MNNDEFLLLILKAKRLLMNLFPFISSSIIYIPVVREPSISSVKINKNKIVIKRNLDISHKASIPFLLLSASFMYSFCIYRRLKGVYKVAYYLASAIYSNTLANLLLYKNGLYVPEHILNNVETYSTLRPLLYPEIKTEKDLLKKSVDEIYRILLKKLIKYKELINDIIIYFYNQKIKNKPISSNLPAINRLKANLIVDFSSIASELNIKDEQLIKYIDKIVNFILGSIERYVEEYLSIKGGKSFSNPIKDFISSAKSFVKSAGGDSLSIENVIELSENYKLSYKNLYQILLNFLTEYRNFFGKYNYNKFSSRRIVLHNLLNNSAIIPKYDYIPTLKVFIVIDSSGSISDKEYEEFINAINYLIHTLRNIEGEVIIFSGKVEKVIPFHVFNKDNLLRDLKTRVGYGGTVFSSVLEHIKNKLVKYNYLIVFTDGVFYENSLSPEYIRILNSFRKILFITTYTIPEYIKNLKNIIILRLSS